MNKILIATRNNDKFKIVSKLLSSNSFKKSKFYCLNDIQETITDEKEIGDVKQRSLQKALNAYNIVNDNYDLIVGIDDGIKMKGKVIENVKEYIKDIIDDNYLVQNEKVFIVRAYTFINKYGKRKTIVTEIPFIYKKITEKFEITENTFPLSHVLCPVGLPKAVFELNDDETNDYYLQFSQSKFDEIERFFQ